MIIKKTLILLLCTMFLSGCEYFKSLSLKTTDIKVYNLINVFSQNYQDKTSLDQNVNEQNSILVPIRLKANQLEFSYNYAMNKTDIFSYQNACYPKIFINSAINQKNPDLYYKPGEWIIYDEKQYYFLQQIYKYSSNNNQIGSFTLVCVDQESLKIHWSRNLAQQNFPLLAFPLKLIQNEHSILVTISDQLRLFCVDKATGQILWEFNPTQLNWNYMKPQETKTTNQLRLIELRIEHQYREGIVVKLSTFNKKTQEHLIKYYILSWNGTIINILDKNPIDFIDNRYLFFQSEEYGIAYLSNNELLWKKHLQSNNMPIIDEYSNILYPFKICNYYFFGSSLFHVGSFPRIG